MIILSIDSSSFQYSISNWLLLAVILTGYLVFIMMCKVHLIVNRGKLPGWCVAHSTCCFLFSHSQSSGTLAIELKQAQEPVSCTSNGALLH